MITGITMGAANVRVLKETLKSMSTICDEIVYGDMLLWEDDIEVLESYKKEFNLKVVKFPFNFLYKNGFSALLNELVSHAKNDLTLYLNTSEIIEEDYGTLDIIKSNPECNTFFFVHKIDPHRWHRLGDRRELKWSGLIHEAYMGEYKPYHKPIFCMADLPKDSGNPFKSIVADILKECVYFKQYIKIADNPDLLGETDPGWLNFAKQDYASFKERLEKRKDFCDALEVGDIAAFAEACFNIRPTNEKFNSNLAIEYQNHEIYLGK